MIYHVADKSALMHGEVENADMDTHNIMYMHLKSYMFHVTHALFSILLL